MMSVLEILSNKDVSYYLNLNNSSQEYKKLIKGNEKSQIKKIHILINKNSYSASNFLAAIIKTSNLGLVLGERSAGGNGSPNHYILPDQTIIDIPDEGGIINKTGRNFELGVKPDIKIDNIDKYSDEELLEKVLKLIKT